DGGPGAPVHGLRGEAQPGERGGEPVLLPRPGHEGGAHPPREHQPRRVPRHRDEHPRQARHRGRAHPRGPRPGVAGIPAPASTRSDEDNLTVGVLTRSELLGVLSDNAGTPEWLALLHRPAPDGCIFVFGALEGLPALYTLGPVFSSDMAN